jgi:hypothetical protein
VRLRELTTNFRTIRAFEFRTECQQGRWRLPKSCFAQQKPQTFDGSVRNTRFSGTRARTPRFLSPTPDALICVQIVSRFISEEEATTTAFLDQALEQHTLAQSKLDSKRFGS